jgi:hypothetical protein
MAKLRREPSGNELLDRIVGLERRCARAETQLADSQRRHEALKGFVMKMAEARKNDRADVTDRLSILGRQDIPEHGADAQQAGENHRRL